MRAGPSAIMKMGVKMELYILKGETLFLFSGLIKRKGEAGTNCWNLVSSRGG